MNETTAQVTTVPAADLAAKQLQHVGAAYAVIFLLVFAFAWRATTSTRRLAERVDELERERSRSA